MVKAICSNCKAVKNIVNAKIVNEGKRTITMGKCETCGKPLRHTVIDMFKRE